MYEPESPTDPKPTWETPAQTKTVGGGSVPTEAIRASKGEKPGTIYLAIGNQLLQQLRIHDRLARNETVFLTLLWSPRQKIIALREKRPGDHGARKLTVNKSSANATFLLKSEEARTSLMGPEKKRTFVPTLQHEPSDPSNPESPAIPCLVFPFAPEPTPE